MKRVLWELETYRRPAPHIDPLLAWGTENNGYFVVPSRAIRRLSNAQLTIIVSDGGGWDHVSVSTPTRCPTWEEMEYVRRMVAEPRETWIQIHPPEAEYVSDRGPGQSPYVLHLWRPQAAQIPLPPSDMV